MILIFTHCRYSSKERASIGKYATMHGAAAAARHFSTKMGKMRKHSEIY